MPDPFQFLRAEWPDVHEAAAKAAAAVHPDPRAACLYGSPFTDVTPRGPDGLFTPPELTELLAILDDVRSAALAA